MGIDLRLIVVRDRDRTWWLERNTLDLDRDYSLQQRIKDAETPKPIPNGTTLSIYGDKGLYDATNDPYGDALTWIEAQAFGSISIVTEYSHWNSAVVTFLKMLPPNTAVVLWWH